ncbi:MAG: hypothetical protein ACREMF_11930 [Gemmatimonadales bacterium]
MSATKQEPSLEARAERLRRLIDEPTDRERARAELVEIERQLAVEREGSARTAAEKILLDSARAIGSFSVQLDERLRDPNARDVIVANQVWEKVLARYELAAVLVKAFPGIKTPSIPVVRSPGRRGLKVDGLSVAEPRRLIAVILASDTEARKVAVWRQAAFAWLHAHRDELPEAIRAAIALPAVASTGPERETPVWVPPAGAVEGDRFGTARS